MMMMMMVITGKMMMRTDAQEILKTLNDMDMEMV